MKIFFKFRKVVNDEKKHKTTKEIATKLNISEKTVRNHISNAIQKLGVTGRSQALVELIKLGELELREDL